MNIKLPSFLNKVPWRKVFIFAPIGLMIYSFMQILTLNGNSPTAETLSESIEQIHYLTEGVCWFGLILFISDSFMNRKAFPIEAVSYQRILILVVLFTLLGFAYVMRPFYLLHHFSLSALYQYAILVYSLSLTTSILTVTAILRIWPRMLATALLLYLFYFASMTHILAPNVLSTSPETMNSLLSDGSMLFSLIAYLLLFFAFLAALDANKDKDIGQAFNDLKQMDKIASKSGGKVKSIKSHNLLIDEIAKYIKPPKPPKPPPPPKKPSIELNNLDALPDFIKKGMSNDDTAKILSLLTEMVINQSKEEKTEK